MIEGGDAHSEYTGPPPAFGRVEEPPNLAEQVVPSGPNAQRPEVPHVPYEQVSAHPPTDNGEAADMGGYWGSTDGSPEVPNTVIVTISDEALPSMPGKELVYRDAELVTIVWSDPEAQEEKNSPGPGEAQIEAYQDGRTKVAPHVAAHVELTYERMLNSPAGNRAHRVIGNGQADTAQLIVVDLATEVGRQRQEMDKAEQAERDKEVDPGEKRYQEALQNPGVVRDLIYTFTPTQDGPLSALQRQGGRSKAETLQPDDIDTFFDKIQPTEAESLTRYQSSAASKERVLAEIPRKRIIKRLTYPLLVQPGIESVDRLFEQEQQDAEKMRGWYEIRRSAEGEPKALKFLEKYYIDKKWRQYETAQANLANREDFEPVPPDAQVERLRAYAAFAWPRIYRANEEDGGGEAAADKMLYEVQQKIFNLKQGHRKRVALYTAEDKGEVAAGNRLGITPEELEDLAELTQVKIQVRLAHGEPTTAPTAVADLVNEMYGEIRRRTAAGHFFERYDELMRGEAPPLTAEEFNTAIEIAGFVHSFLQRVSPTTAAQHLADTSMHIQEGLRGEQRFRELQENPHAFAQQSGLPFGSANELLDVEDVKSVRSQFLEHIVRTNEGRTDPTPEQQGVLYALDRHSSALENDHDGRYRDMLERRASDLAREQESEQFNKGWTLWVNGPTVKGDGSAGALMAFFIAAKQAKGGIDTMGDSWVNQHTAEFLGADNVRRIEYVAGTRRYELMLFEGRVPRSIAPNVLEQLEPGGMAAFQVRPGINEEFAVNAVRGLDELGFNRTFPNTVKQQADAAHQQDPSRSRYWPRGTIGYGAEGYLWAMVPSGVCRWGLGPDGKPIIAYGHKDGIDRGEEWTLLVFRNKDMNGRPSDYYQALRQLAMLVGEDTAY